MHSFLFVYSGSKRCPSLFGITDIRFLPRNFRNTSLFTTTCENSLSARRISADNHLSKTSISLGNLLLLSDKFCANLWHFIWTLCFQILTFWHRSFTFNSNKSPTWCNNFSVYYPDVCLQLNMFRALSRPSSGAQWLQWQPLVLPSYRGDRRGVFVVGPAGRLVGTKKGSTVK
jgi:hypothetical protein